MPVSSCTKYSKSLNKKFTHETLVDKSLQNSKKDLLSVQLALNLIACVYSTNCVLKKSRNSYDV